MTDKEYVNCKRIIKNWEKKFKEQEKRNPTKDDIRNASSCVKDAYKLYWYIKTSLLEKAIIDDENTCSKIQSSIVPDLSDRKNTNNCSISKSIKFEELTNSSPSLDVLKESVALDNSISEFVNKETVWGDHLKKVNFASKEFSLKKSTSYQFTEKLFKGLKFKKRNPRKSLKHSEKLKSSQNLSISSDENSLNPSDTSSNSADVPKIISNVNSVPDTIKRVQITGGKSLNSAQAMNIFCTDLDSPSAHSRLLKNKIDEGWLNRCSIQCKSETTNKLVSSNKEKNNERRINAVLSSDEDYVYSSEDEMSKTNCLNFTSNDLVPSLNVLSDSANIQKTYDSTISIPDSAATSLAEAPINPVIAAKNLINNRSNYGFGGTKRPATSDSCNNEKKLKTTTNFDSTCKMKLLEKKVSSGKANENFVSIDLKRKRFVRGQKRSTFSKFKKQNWKMKKNVASIQSSSADSSLLKCFKCGDVGHYSKQCKKRNLLLPMEEFIDIEESPFPTLEEAAQMAKAKRKCEGEDNEIAELLEMCDSLDEPELNEGLKSVPPLCDCSIEENIEDNATHLYQALKKFGYDTFRPGQKEVMMRIISGKSTLYVSSTGSGKSLCYQLPAYLYAQRYKCVSLIISPLVSLMEDQVINFPSFLNAACLHTNQTAQQRDKIVKKLQNNKISVLLISPESMISSENGILGRNLVKNFPPIAFVCIDEVHCVSQWSHNFRTSYLMICKVLKERFKVNTFLGLTATATKNTISCIIEHLNIPDDEIENAVIQHTVLPNNLILSVSKDVDRDISLVQLLKQPPFSDFDSIIIYCLRRNECERLASFLRLSLRDLKKPIQMFGEKKTLSADVEVYHAGISATQRKRVQHNFMTGKLRIVVATVAFGMGINKADIRSVIHYNMPRTFEHYVQEIGRAGRDELPARCHLFYDAVGNDLPELKRHIFANSVDRHVIRKLLKKVFRRCDCVDSCKKHELAFSVESTVQALDLNQESITTLLCYLEMLPERYIKVLPAAYTICTVQSFGGVRALQEAAKKCPPLAYAIAEHCKNTNSSKINNKFDFDVIALAEKIKWNSGVVKNELKQCEWKEVNGSYHKTAVSITFHDVGFHIESPGNLTETEMDHALDALHEHVISQEDAALAQLDICNRAFETVAYSSIDDSLFSNDLVERNNILKEQINKYFTEDFVTENTKKIETELHDKATVMCNIHRLVSSNRDCNFTGRTVARIFHGIESPNYPALFWARSPLWRCGLNEDFNALCRFASRELVKLS